MDTNVLSELMRPDPHQAVVTWVAAQRRASLYTTAVNRAEVLHGIADLPFGRRRDGLLRAADALFREDLGGRVLPFDADSAAEYAEIVARRRRAGAPIDRFDALIAAVSLSAGAAVATRDLGGFAGCGLVVINPWEAA